MDGLLAQLLTSFFDYCIAWDYMVAW